MAEAKLPTAKQLDNLGWAISQAKAHAKITCSRVVELLEDKTLHLEPILRIALTTIRHDCEHVLTLWED